MPWTYWVLGSMRTLTWRLRNLETSTSDVLFYTFYNSTSHSNIFLVFCASQVEFDVWELTPGAHQHTLAIGNLANRTRHLVPTNGFGKRAGIIVWIERPEGFRHGCLLSYLSEQHKSWKHSSMNFGGVKQDFVCRCQRQGALHIRK
jgi:hypothetical protein